MPILMTTIFTGIFKTKRHTFCSGKILCCKGFNFFTSMALSLGERVFRIAKSTSKTIGGMLAVVGIKFKVFYSVIVFNFIDMMDNLALFKMPPKMFLHYKAVLGNIAKTVFIGVVRGVDILVAVVNFPTDIINWSLPLLKFSGRRISLSLMRQTHFLQCFLRETIFYSLIPRNVPFGEIAFFHTTNYNTKQAILQHQLRR